MRRNRGGKITLNELKLKYNQYRKKEREKKNNALKVTVAGRARERIVISVFEIKTLHFERSGVGTGNKKIRNFFLLFLFIIITTHSYSQPIETLKKMNQKNNSHQILKWEEKIIIILKSTIGKKKYMKIQASFKLNYITFLPPQSHYMYTLSIHIFRLSHLICITCFIIIGF